MPHFSGRNDPVTVTGGRTNWSHTTTSPYLSSPASWESSNCQIPVHRPPRKAIAASRLPSTQANSSLQLNRVFPGLLVYLNCSSAVEPPPLLPPLVVPPPSHLQPPDRPTTRQVRKAASPRRSCHHETRCEGQKAELCDGWCLVNGLPLLRVACC